MHARVQVVNILWQGMCHYTSVRDATTPEGEQVDHEVWKGKDRDISNGRIEKITGIVKAA